MLKIWGRTNSVNVKKALWCLEELGLPYDRTDAGMAYGVVNTPVGVPLHRPLSGGEIRQGRALADG